MATTLELYAHASASTQRDTVSCSEANCPQMSPSWRVMEILRRKNLKCFSKLVGAPGFEPETSSAQGSGRNAI